MDRNWSAWTSGECRFSILRKPRNFDFVSSELFDVFGDGHDYEFALGGDDDQEYDEEQPKPWLKYLDVNTAAVACKMIDDLARYGDRNRLGSRDESSATILRYYGAALSQSEHNTCAICFPPSNMGALLSKSSPSPGIFKLRCLIIGEADVFTVQICPGATVDELKSQILKALANSYLRGTDANDVKLWKVRRLTKLYREC
jgi:hypothetical protein